jgi:hypothetical protein
MIAVAVVAIVAGGLIETRRLRRQGRLYGTWAALHTQLEQQNQELLAHSRRMVSMEESRTAPARSKESPFFSEESIRMMDESIEEMRARIAYHEERSRYHAALKQKYERAARYPFVPVPPDPPEPK